MKKIIKSLGIVLALWVQSAYAIPTLYFDGAITFTSSSAAPSELSVTATLFETLDITPEPVLAGSALSFSSVFDSLIPTSNPDFTAGLFGGGSGLTVTGGDSTELLTGDFNYLYMVGMNGSSSGQVRGEITATGGSLADLFGIGTLIALEFDLDTVFSATMFDNSFAGKINGRLEGEEPTTVPAPGVLTLLGLGLVLIGIIRRVRSSTLTNI